MPLGIEDEFDDNEFGSEIEADITKAVTLSLEMDLGTLQVLVRMLNTYNREIGRMLPSGLPGREQRIITQLSDIEKKAAQ